MTADIFREWVVLGGMELGTIVAKWWTGLATGLDGEDNGLKDEPDETAGDLFWRMCRPSEEQRTSAMDTDAKGEHVQKSQAKAGPSGKRDVEATMSVQDMVAWLKKYVGEDFGLGVGESREELIEHVQLELAVVVDNYAYVTSTGTFDAPGDVEDVEQESMRRIMSVVLGSPEIAKDPVHSTSWPAFASSPLGVGYRCR